VNIVGNTFSDAVATTGGGGISLNPYSSVKFVAKVADNTMTHLMNALANAGAVSITNGGTANADITVSGNTISSIAQGRGITATATGGTTDLWLDQNTIDNLGLPTSASGKSAINVSFAGDSGLGTNATGNVTISNNAIGTMSAASNLWAYAGGNPANAILVVTQNGSSMDAAITDNQVVNANTLYEVARIRAVGTSTLDATVSGNSLSDTYGNHIEFDATAGNASPASAGTVNLSITGNDLGANGVLQLTENTLGTLNVTQDAATVASSNLVTPTETGSVNYGAIGSPSMPVLPLAPEDVTLVGIWPFV
jgi:hypothetical protein